MVLLTQTTSGHNVLQQNDRGNVSLSKVASRREEWMAYLQVRHPVLTLGTLALVLLVFVIT